MGKTKNAMDRYLALDRCFQLSGGVCIDDMLLACEKALGYSVSKKTIYDDIAHMESNDSWGIKLDRWYVDRKRYYAYSDRHFSISGSPFNAEEINLIQSAAQILEQYKGLPGAPILDELTAFLKDKFGYYGTSSGIMTFEENEELIGREYITSLYNAIVEKKALEIVYRPFEKDEIVWQIFPYHLKQYNGRWFLFGLNNEEYKGKRHLVHLALDRIVSIKNARIPYIDNTDFDFGCYFDDVVGVTINAGEPINIVLKFSQNRYNFVKTKPIHPYQVNNDTDNIVSLNVIPNKELESLILSFGDDVEVLSPEYYREEIKKKIRAICKKYDV